MMVNVSKKAKIFNRECLKHYIKCPGDMFVWQRREQSTTYLENFPGKDLEEPIQNI